MFTACTYAPVKDVILKAFINPDGISRVVVATVAFGMGMDCHTSRLRWCHLKIAVDDIIFHTFHVNTKTYRI